jgi:1-acyl-sn-glycerol-3-phosphate acyltransferase
MIFLSGCRLKIYKEFKIDKNYLIFSNHQSMLDIFVINSILDLRDYRWLVKSSLFYIPIFGLLLYSAGYISVERRKKYKAYKAIQKAINLLNKGKVSIIIFPEGTRSTEDTILKFKSGGIKIALSSNKEVLPIILKNTLYAKKRKSFMINPIIVKAKILKPVDLKNFSKRDGIDYIYNLMLEEYKKL